MGKGRVINFKSINMKKNTLLYVFLFLPEILCIIWAIIAFSSCTTTKPQPKRYQEVKCDEGHIHRIPIERPRVNQFH
jgi:hypothetical protein